MQAAARLVRTRVVCEQKAQPRLWQHLSVDRLNLVGKRANSGEADRKLPVVGIREADADRLDQKAQPFWVHGANRRGFVLPISGGEDSRRLLGGNDRFFQRAVR